MALVGYSDSESSDDEQKISVPKPASSKAASSKPTFKKVIDRSNPHKIVVNLPSEPQKDNDNAEEPPAKKPRLGGGGLSGFNAMLPAPKKTGPVAPGNMKRSGLGSGVNLKTGATPGFSREPVISASESGTEENKAENAGGDSRTVEDDTLGSVPAGSTPASVEEPKKVGNPMMFKPLSVARKPQKKKPITSSSASTATPSTPASTPLSRPSASLAAAPEPKPAPKISLFSMGPSDDIYSSSNQTPYTSNDYTPLLHKPQPADPSTTDAYSSSDAYTQPQPSNSNSTSSSDPNSLQGIANDLNLSASARRQLLGRGMKGPSSTVKITHFSTDAEYASNEELRQQGEEQVHNPVRAIAPGKHSLKQLVNAVSNQKEAFEDSFAAGRRNRKEAGSKYGW